MPRNIFVEATYRTACESTGKAIALILRDKIIEELVRGAFPVMIQAEDPFKIEVVSAGARTGSTVVTLDVSVEFEGYSVPSSMLPEQDELRRALIELFMNVPGLEISVETGFTIRPTLPSKGKVPELQPV